nr:MAG: hypothetical protein [Bacteriophage sp.]
MTEVKDKLVDLKDLGAYHSKIKQTISDLEYVINEKLGPADNEGAAGQVLMLVDKSQGAESPVLMWGDPQGSSPSMDEATVRKIVNEQLAKTKFTINDQGHLIIETPEA